MRKQVIITIICSLLAVPFTRLWADTVVDGQSTEGTDFWVTFLQADQGGADFSLDLAISSRYHCEVTISNPFTSYSEKVTVVPGQTTNVNMDASSNGAKTGDARSRQTKSGKICYAFNSEKIDTCALHIVSDSAISLFASNYQYASFDATNVLPSTSLQDEYIIQTYSPSDNAGDDASQGSHFAIIATEDNTIVDITPSVATKGGKTAGETFATETLKKGQVYYVWTGKGVVKQKGDLSGSHIKARDGKKIAVFQGCPHTNIPYKVKLRDHIYSQAMPVQTWGNSFVITASTGRKRDIFRLYALNDETMVYFGNSDTPVYTFHFEENNPSSHYWEFELGQAYGDLSAPDINGTSSYIHTSCPCALHQFMVSQQYDGDKNNNGDPAMLWINPIEQQINQITFTTYSSKKGETAHNINIVTANPEGVTLDGKNIKSEFSRVPDNDTYWFARHSLGKITTSYTLKNDSGNFIAHVYGFTKNESYAYSAGGYVKSLTQYITINGEIFTPDTKNTLCGVDTIEFECHPDYEYTQVVWSFGDGESKTFTKAEADAQPIVPHYYPISGTYNAYVLIYRESSNVCVGQNAVDSIPIEVTIGRYEFSLGELDLPCPAIGQPYLGYIPYTNAGSVDLKGDNVTIQFDEAAKRAGFDDKQLIINEDYFQITVPENDLVSSDSIYGLHLTITSDCGGTDTTMLFRLSYDKNVMVLRPGNILGLSKKAFKDKVLSNFQWYRVSDSTAIAGETTSILNFSDLPAAKVADDAYYVCFDILDNGVKDSTCTCAKEFAKSGSESGDDHVTYEFLGDSALAITASYVIDGQKIYVNADWGGKTDIECYAQWINVSGEVVNGQQFSIPDGGCPIDVPSTNGFYILRVVTDGAKRSFKFIINH